MSENKSKVSDVMEVDMEASIATVYSLAFCNPIAVSRYLDITTFTYLARRFENPRRNVSAGSSAGHHHIGLIGSIKGLTRTDNRKRKSLLDDTCDTCSSD